MEAIGFATAKVDYVPRDYIELRMRKRERFTLLSQEGDFWFIARNRNGEEGYIPSAHVIVDKRESIDLVYKRWKKSRDTLLAEGAIDVQDWAALAVPKEVAFCSDRGCRAWKETDDHGIGSEGTFAACEHELERFFRAEQSYGAEWLKIERIRWHPDWFAARCKPTARESLSKRASHMFKTISKLYEAEASKVDQAEALKAAESPVPTRNDTGRGSAPEQPRPTLPKRNPKHSIKLDSAAPFATTSLESIKEGLDATNGAPVSVGGPPACIGLQSACVANLNARDHEATANEISINQRKGLRPCNSTNVQSYLQESVASVTSAPNDESKTRSPHRLNPSAQSFQPISTAMEHLNISNVRSLKAWSSKPSHSPSTAIPPVGNLDPPTTTAKEAPAWYATCAVDSQLVSFKPCSAPDLDACHDDCTNAESDMDTEHDQVMLVRARNARAQLKMMNVAPDEAIAAKKHSIACRRDYSMESRNSHDRKTTRERWGKPQPMEDRIAQQARRKANAARMRATVASRREARAHQKCSTTAVSRASLTDLHAASSDNASDPGDDEPEDDEWNHNHSTYASPDTQGQTLESLGGESGWCPASGPPSVNSQ